MKKSISTISETDEATLTLGAGITGCGPAFAAMFIEALSDELDGQVDFFNVDVDDCPEIAAEYAIMSIPALILFKDGKSVDMKVGFRPQAELAAWIKGELN